jgi:hypothetical protein
MTKRGLIFHSSSSVRPATVPLTSLGGLEQDVGVGDEAFEDVAALLGGDVERERAHVPAFGLERESARVAEDVGAPGALDPDDVSAVLGEELGRDRARPPMLRS